MCSETIQIQWEPHTHRRTQNRLAKRRSRKHIYANSLHCLYLFSPMLLQEMGDLRRNNSLPILPVVCQTTGALLTSLLSIHSKSLHRFQIRTLPLIPTSRLRSRGSAHLMHWIWTDGVSLLKLTKFSQTFVSQTIRTNLSHSQLLLNNQNRKRQHYVKSAPMTLLGRVGVDSLSTRLRTLRVPVLYM